MPLLTIYLSGSVAVLTVLIVCCARSLRRDPKRLLAIAVAAALWPVLAVGLLQFGAVHALVTYLRRHTSAPAPAPVAVGAPPPTVQMDLVDSLTRVANRIGVTRPA